MIWLFGSIFLISALLCVLFYLAQRSLLLSSPLPKLSDEKLEPISILKPLKGVDSQLEENLRSFFSQNYPRFEILLGAMDTNDPALAIARKVAAEFPQVPSQIVVGHRKPGFNPKVNNLFNLEKNARHSIYLISDSNVRVQPNFLLNSMAHLSQPNVNLVSAPIRARDGHGLGASLEALHLHSFVMGGVAAITKFFRQPCVVGKSMLFRKNQLEKIGGFEKLSNYLAEDQVCGEELARLGGICTVSESYIENVQGSVSTTQFLQRQLRWAQIRYRINFPAYCAESFSNPTLMSILALVLIPSPATVAATLGLWTLRSVLAISSEHLLLTHRSAWTIPPLLLLKDLLLGGLWFVPFFKNTVQWRGNALRIGKRTKLQPLYSTESETASITDRGLLLET